MNVIHQIASDAQLQTILLLIVADLILGVAAAFKTGPSSGPNGPASFELAYVANFMRNDVLGKALPWAVLDVLALAAPNTSVFASQVNLTNLSHGAFVAVSAALVGSLLGSLKDLGLDLIPPQLGSGR